MIFYVQSDPLDLQLDLLRCNDENSRVNCANVLSIYMLINTTYIIIAVTSLVVGSLDRPLWIWLETFFQVFTIVLIRIL